MVFPYFLSGFYMDVSVYVGVGDMVSRWIDR